MAKVKVKKQNTFIDMTAMSDVTVLLLTFFMLTSTFIQKEPIQVNTPASVSEFTIPETNILTILVDAKGKIFLSLDNTSDRVEALKAVGEDYGYEFTGQQLTIFKNLSTFGVPMAVMKEFLDYPTEEQDKYLSDVANSRVGIPTDSVEVRDMKGVISRDNEFKRWVGHAKQASKDRQEKLVEKGIQEDVYDLQIAIKADQTTHYPVVKKVMDDLRDMRENRYLLITNLKTASNE
ncbi:MAG: biopolymer transporter ExbD [Candidatus Symbiothrix sp.]|jgi:biopolymer transport protein ExbD|nr:biopolymer transporter ExbD [Candidatus Symbiothrix sp.]